MTSDGERMKIPFIKPDVLAEEIPNLYLSKADKGESMNSDFKQYCLKNRCAKQQALYHKCETTNTECISQYMQLFNCVNQCVQPKVFKYLHTSTEGISY